MEYLQIAPKEYLSKTTCTNAEVWCNYLNFFGMYCVIHILGTVVTVWAGLLTAVGTVLALHCFDASNWPLSTLDASKWLP